MPIVRYQIRNEYGLADPELYGAADKEDPEALLEGVAMAGLVGVLRQLGDLAEFAAEIFHNLHEEVMATAARGHALMLRVQQLEVDFPAIERDFLSPSRHSHLYYNAGIEWHPNLQIDQNLITREDMPRFILDSYEESRGPPRLFMLDKFDIAGDGACLKRYSNPSFFKMDFTASGKMEPDIQREKRPRKHKKKAPRWRNGGTPEPYITLHGNPTLEPIISEKVPENPSIKRVKLKQRQLNDNTSVRRSYIEYIAGNQSPEHINLSEMKAVGSTESAPAVREVIVDTSVNKPSFREKNHTKHHPINFTQKDETVSDLWDNQNKKQKGPAAIERLPPNFTIVDHDLFDAAPKREANDDSVNKAGSVDGSRSDDAASELDNYLDALTTMDSEIETDNEAKARAIPGFFSKEYNKMDSVVKEEKAALDSEVECDNNESKVKPTPNFFSGKDNQMHSNLNVERATVNCEIETDDETGSTQPPTSFTEEYRMDSNADEERDILDEHLGSHMVRETSDEGSLSIEKISSPSHGRLNILADSIPCHDAQTVLSEMCTDPETPANKNHDTDFEIKAYCERLGKESPTNLVSDEIIPALLSNSGVVSSSSTDTTSQIYIDLQASLEGKLSGSSNENASSVNTTSTEESSMCFDGEHSPPKNSNVLEPMADTNVMFCHPNEEHGEVGKLMERDFSHSSDGSKTTSVAENDKVNPGLISKDTEIVSGALLQLGDGFGLNHQMEDDPSLVSQTELLCTKEQSADIIAPISSVSDLPQIIKAPNLKNISSICMDDSSPPLMKFNEVELHGSVFQGSVELGGSTLLGGCPPLGGNSSVSECDALSGPVDNSHLSDEKVECARTLTYLGDAADFVVNEDTNLEDVDNFAESEVIASDILSSGPFVDMQMPQESCSSDQAEFRHEDDLPNILQVLPYVSGKDTRDSFSDQAEFRHEDDLPNILKVLPVASGKDTRDSFLVNETKNSPSATGEASAEGSSYSISQYTEVNEVSSATMQKEIFPSDIIIIEENHVSSVLVSEQQKLEVTEAPSLKNLIDLNVCQVPDTAAALEEYVVNSGPQDSAATGYVLDSSPIPACGELNHVHCVEQLELGQEDLTQSDGRRAAICFVEMGGEEFVSQEPKDKSVSVDSDVEHYLGNIKASDSEDITAADDQQTSILASPGKEDAKVVSDLGDTNSVESIHDSCDSKDMKLIVSVPCQDDQKTVVSLQNSSTEERLPESSNADTEIAQHAEINMHPFEVNEDLESPSENQISQPLALYEPGQGTNGDALLSRDVITENCSPVKEVFNSLSSGESSEISLLQDFGKLSLSDTRFERECSHGQERTVTDTWPLVLKTAQDSVEAAGSGKIYESGVPSAHVSTLNQQEAEPGSSLQSSSGILTSSLISSMSLPSLQSFPGHISFGTAVVQQRSSESPPDKDPPLPPLPPLQWRMGKLRPSSIMSNGVMAGPQRGLNNLTGEIAGPQSRLNNLTTPASLYHLGGSVVTGAAEVQQANPFLRIEMHTSDDDQFVNQTLVKERVNCFRSSAPVPTMEDNKCEEEISALDIEMKHLSANSSVVSHALEDQQKNEPCKEALVGEVPQLNSPTSLLELPDETSQHFAEYERESVEPTKSSASKPTSISREYLQDMGTLETLIAPPSNPFLLSTSTEGVPYRYDYGASENRIVPHLNTPDPSSMAEIAPYLLISHGDNVWPFESLTLPAAENGTSNGRPRSLLNRPRDPLIEAVAAHDKSTLRRVSEMVLPSAEPESERNTLLEQIRNKSFSLKPATVSKPHIKGPPTNLKVAAILERANAIRQAFAGSDEDDDEGSWSDS